MPPAYWTTETEGAARSLLTSALNGDTQAEDSLTALVLDLATRFLSGKPVPCPCAQRERNEDIAIVATWRCLRYLKAGKYDPERGRLFTFLTRCVQSTAQSAYGATIRNERQIPEHASIPEHVRDSAVVSEFRRFSRAHDRIVSAILAGHTSTNAIATHSALPRPTVESLMHDLRMRLLETRNPADN